MNERGGAEFSRVWGRGPAFPIAIGAVSSICGSWLAWHLKYGLLGAFFVFGLAGVLGAMPVPERPLRAACLALFGVAVGVVVDLILHPATPEGYERNLPPIEIGIMVVVAALPILIGALAWRNSVHSRRKDAQDIPSPDRR